MQNNDIDYKRIRDDQLLYWMHWLRHDAQPEVRQRYGLKAAEAAFRKGLVGEEWFDYFAGNTNTKPCDLWKDTEVSF